MFLNGRRLIQKRPHARGAAGRRSSGHSLSIATFCVLFAATKAQSEIVDLNPPPIYDFYGEVGLLDMPTARLRADGELSMTVSVNPIMERYNLGFQALPWLEAVFRYSRLDRYYSAGPGGDLYDRSLSIRARLFQETEFWPAIAVGARDILGTGAFGAEYIVASKKIGDLDFTGGIGWRRLGDTATFPNPFGLIFPSFKNATGFGNQGNGLPLLNQFFHGEHAGLIGGVSWHTPIDRLSLIAELSGDRFSAQASNGAIHVRSPVNFGFSYEPWDGIQFAAGYLYGTQFGFSATIHFNPFDDSFPSRLGTQPVDPRPRSEEARNDAELDLLQSSTHFYSNWPATSLQLEPNATRADISPNGLTQANSLADLIFDDRNLRALKISDVEGYGSSLLLDTSSSSQNFSCRSLASLSESAHAAGFRQIILSESTGSRDAEVCAIPSPERFHAPQSDQTKLVAQSEFSAPVSAQERDTKPSNGLHQDSSQDVIDADSIKAKILKDATAQKLEIQRIALFPHEIDLAFANSHYRTDTEAIGRLIRVVMNDAPDRVEQIRLTIMIGYLPVRQLLFHRSDIERIQNMSGSAYELLPSTDILAPSWEKTVEQDNLVSFPTFGVSLAPEYRQSLFDPSEPYRYQFYASLNGAINFSPNFSISGALEANIYNTLNKIDRVSNSELPHVRSDFALYYKHGSNGIGRLTADYVTKFASDVYFTAHLGYLESMYAGLGAEIYWRPPHQRLSFGATLYEVKQRNFDRLFGFRPYHVLTGHVTAYYDSPFYDLNFQLHVGRYLAGDYGATLQVTRRFDSGVEIGIYATLTNVPFSVYGEGSFDKGFIVRIPLDYVVPLNTPTVANLDFSPLTRDGGQSVEDEDRLYYVTRPASEGELLSNWNKVLDP